MIFLKISGLDVYLFGHCRRIEHLRKYGGFPLGGM